MTKNIGHKTYVPENISRRIQRFAFAYDLPISTAIEILIRIGLDAGEVETAKYTTSVLMEREEAAENNRKTWSGR